MSRKFLIVFVAAFLLNILWEEAHSALYVSYQGGAITNFILFRAALFDAAVIALFAYLCSYSPLSKGALPSSAGGMSIFIFVLALFIFAILLEKWALATGRWVYADAMPLVPLLNVGLTPAIQLGVSGYVSMRFSNCCD
ncbi:MAG TPA: hypothetical protein VJJ55_00495 [Candidatus Paceibacterota bacterium]